MQVKRSIRVGDTIKAEIGNILMRELKDPRIGFITITRVSLADDLKNADIYFTRIGDSEERKASLKALLHAKSFIRWELAKRLRIKSMPSLRFYLDDDMEKSERIEFLLNELHQKNDNRKHDTDIDPGIK